MQSRRWLHLDASYREDGQRVAWGAAAFRKPLDSKYPVGHAGEPDDIEWGTFYLATDESKFVTDTELITVGGYTAQ